MSTRNAQSVINEILGRYADRTARSRAYNEQARQHLPGGDTRGSTYFTPYPAYMESGDGCHLYDSDGNTYVDFSGNYASLIHGHAHPPTVLAVEEQLKKGSVLGAPALPMLRHAEMLRKRMPSLELLRYCNSGTEATMYTLRAARAFTKKDMIVKLDGGFHGTHDYAEVSVTPDTETKQPPYPPRLSSRGVSQTILQDVVVVPFNDLEAMELALATHRDRLAAILMEPMMGAAGQIPPLPGYLHGVRDLANRYQVLLILDEIVTFRLSLGGIQVREELRPDLTAVAKIIGGGFPCGAFGGRKDILSLFSPDTPQCLHHSGTFNANSITMAAGIATLEAYDQQAVERLNGLGDRLRAGFREAFRAAGIRGTATGLGSLVDIHWTDGPIISARDGALAHKAAGALPKWLHLAMMNRGFFAPQRGQFALSTPMTTYEVDQLLEAFAATLEDIRPYIAEETPHLIA